MKERETEEEISNIFSLNKSQRLLTPIITFSQIFDQNIPLKYWNVGIL